MKKVLTMDNGKKCIITSNMQEREFIYGYDLTEKQLDDQYTSEDIFIKNGYLIALSEIIRQPESDTNICNYINGLGSFDGLTVLPSYCSIYDILAINNSYDGYVIFSVKII